MYTVYIDDEVLYSPLIANEGYSVLTAKSISELNRAGSFEFTLPPNNVFYDSIQKLKSVITIVKDGVEIFRGRVLHDEKDFYKRKAVYCEGELAFLLDSIQRPYSFQGDVTALFTQFLNNHNNQVDDWKQFQVGEVTVTDSNAYINRKSSDYPNTFDEMNAKLVNTHGGYLKPRLQDGTKYLDYLEESGKVNSQVIEFGVNLLDITEYITAEDVFTVLIPLGAKGTDESGNETSRLTVESVNNGKDYIENELGISLFGRIVKKQEWDDVTVADNLLTKGTAFLESGIEMSVSLTLKAIDLHLIDVDTESIMVGDSIRVISVPHNIDTFFQCSKIELNLLEPDKSVYTFGITFTALTEKNVSNSKEAYQIANNAQQAISNTNQEVSNLANSIQGIDGKLTQEELFKILTNNGQVQGILLDEKTGDIYVNASYIKSGMLTLGGDNPNLKIVDSEGVVCVEADEDGIHILDGEVNATSGTLENMTIIDGINISSKTDESMQDIPLIAIEEYENANGGTSFAVTLGDYNKDVTVKGDFLKIRGAMGLIFSADNIVFENAFEAPTAYIDTIYGDQIVFDRSNDEKQIFFKTQTSSGTYTHNCKLYGGNSESKVAIAMYDYQNEKRIFAYDDQSMQIVSDITKYFLGNSNDDQTNVYFYTTDEATNVHKCKIYGGEGESTTALGMYDVLNDRAIWVYNDVDNIIRSNAYLSDYELAVTAQADAGASAVSNQSTYFPFLKMVNFKARFDANAVSADEIATLGTIDSTYAPNGFATALSVYTTAGDCVGYATADGSIKFKPSKAITAGTKIYVDGCWRY